MMSWCTPQEWKFDELLYSTETEVKKAVVLCRSGGMKFLYSSGIEV
jgi:hypothetical protein